MVSKQVFNFIINEFDYKLTNDEPSYYVSRDQRLNNKSTNIMNNVIVNIRKKFNQPTLLNCLNTVRSNFVIDPTYALIDDNDHYFLEVLFTDNNSSINHLNDIIISEILLNEFFNLDDINKLKLADDLKQINVTYVIATQKIK